MLSRTVEIDTAHTDKEHILSVLAARELSGVPGSRDEGALGVARPYRQSAEGVSSGADGAMLPTSGIVESCRFADDWYVGSTRRPIRCCGAVSCRRLRRIQAVSRFCSALNSPELLLLFGSATIWRCCLRSVVI